MTSILKEYYNEDGIQTEYFQEKGEKLKLMIKEERERRGWSQTQAAQAVGITKAAYRNIEAGVRKPSYDILVKLLDLFDCSDPRKLFGAATPEQE